MATIQELKQLVDMHQLAGMLGLERPGGSRGNYRGPGHKDKNPSLSIRADGKGFTDFYADISGDCIQLVQHVEGMDTAGAIRRIHELFGWPMERREAAQPARQKSTVEFIAEKCMATPSMAKEYLISRGISEATVDWAIKRGAVGYSTWHSTRVEPSTVGYGGPAAAFICRDQTNAIRSVDVRYLDPDLNGGVKTKSTGDKEGVPWFVCRDHLKRAATVVVCESAINALCVEACGLPLHAAIATRGAGAVDAIDWRICTGKFVIIAMDADKPNDKGIRPGSRAAWAIYDRLVGLNIAAMLVDQSSWYRDDLNDIADIANAGGLTAVRDALRELEPWAIPGLVGGKDAPLGKQRVFLPAHDYAVYWKYRTKADFISYIAKTERDEDGNEQPRFEDVAGFRVAALSRITIQSATATMSGEADSMPNVQFAVSVQVPRHGPQLLRRVFSDERLHNVEHWKRLGSIYNPQRFLRMVNILERGVDCGSRDAVNFVGLAWREGKPIVNEGPDCYFSEPEKQCPYHALTFPSGPVRSAASVVQAYQDTFKDNAATLLLVWALGAHMKLFLGMWPHMIMQADKGSGKSTLIKRLERSIAMTMFGGQSLQTEFRLLTSISHTSHPVGWEEISARRQDIINTAVAMLQESYQHTVTRRGSDLTEFLISAPVLLAGEDVPVRSLTGKVVRSNLTGRKGPLMPEGLPKFPVREWLQFLATMDRTTITKLHMEWETWCWAGCRANKDDSGAARMVRNYAAICLAWGQLCEFAGIPQEQGNFLADIRAAMNEHIKETTGDREPWVWIMELITSEIESRKFLHPYDFDLVGDEECLLIRPQHVMDHIANASNLRDHWNGLPVKSGRVFRRQLDGAGVVVKDELDRKIGGRRHAHMTALGLDRLAKYGLHLSQPVPGPPPSMFDNR